MGGQDGAKRLELSLLAEYLAVFLSAQDQLPQNGFHHLGGGSGGKAVPFSGQDGQRCLGIALRRPLRHGQGHDLILIPLEKLLKRVPADIGAWSSFVLFLVTRGINYKFLGFELLKFIRLPQGLYRNPVTAFFGFPPDNFYSADYFSLLPWFFLFVTGYFLKRLFEELGWLKYLKGTKIAPLEWIGRHCLILYMLHQPVIYGLLSLGRRTAG